jgi:hypothetical protein
MLWLDRLLPSSAETLRVPPRFRESLRPQNLGGLNSPAGDGEVLGQAHTGAAAGLQCGRNPLVVVVDGITHRVRRLPGFSLEALVFISECCVSNVWGRVA